MSLPGSKAAGFTLIELMISLAIGAIVIGAGLTLYVQTSSNRNLLQAELALQENSYYIDQTLRQLLNQTGHRPLNSTLLPTPVLPIYVPDDAFAETSGSASPAGTAGGGTTQGGWEKGEYIRVENNGISIRFNGSSDASGDADGTIVDCQGGAIAESETADISFTVVDGALQCTSAGVSVDLIAQEDSVMIEDVALLWGLDTNNDNSVDNYVTATNTLDDSDTLRSIRMLLLLSSRDEVAVSNPVYAFNGVEYTSTDSRIRREVATTVLIKN